MNDMLVNALTATRLNERLSTVAEELDSMYCWDGLNDLPDDLNFAIRCDLLLARDRVKFAVMTLGEATDG